MGNALKGQFSKGAPEVLAREEGSGAGDAGEDNVPDDVPHASIVPREGIRASYLIDFIEEHGALLTGKSTSDVCENIIRPATDASRGSYVELLLSTGHAREVGPANLFVSHVWSYSFLYLADAILAHLERHFLPPESTFLWIDLFSVPHADPMSRHVLAGGAMRYMRAYKHNMSKIRTLLLVVEGWQENMVCLKRAWCVAELYLLRTSGGFLHVTMGHEEGVKFTALLRSAPERAESAVAWCDSAQMEARQFLDQAMLTAVMDHNVTFARLDSLIVGMLQTYVVHEIQRRISSAVQIHRNEVEASNWHCTLTRLYMTKRTATSSADSLLHATTAIDIRERCCGQDDERTVQARQLLACHYRTHGDTSHALAALESVLQSRTRALGEAHPLTLAAMNDVAGLWLQIGMKVEAEEMLSNTLALRRAELGNAHPDTAVSIHNLASFLVQERRWAQGLALFTELEAWRAEHLGRESKEYLSAVNNVAVCLDKMEKFDEACAKYEQCIEMQIDVHGTEDPITLRTMNNLACLYDKMQQLHKAFELSEECYELRQRVLGPHHQDTLFTMSQFASVCYRLQLYDQSLRLYVECVEQQGRLLGKTHPDTVVTMNNLATLYSKVDLYHKALPICQQVYLSQASLLGLHHRDTMGAMANLATALFKAGDYSTACPMLEQCLSQRQEVFGDEHPDTVSAMNNLAYCCLAMGDDETAYALLERALALRRHIHGDAHPHTVQAGENLIEMYRKMGAYDKVMLVKERLAPAYDPQSSRPNPFADKTTRILARRKFSTKGDDDSHSSASWGDKRVSLSVPNSPMREARHVEGREAPDLARRMGQSLQ